MEENPVPVMFEHCCKVYAEMRARASEERPIIDGQVSDEADLILVYEGHLTGLFQSLGMSVPYYTTIMKALKGMRSVEQLRRGGGTAKSRWQLNHEPTEEGFVAYAAHAGVPKSRGIIAALEQRIQEHERRLVAIETYLQRSTSNAA